MGLSGYRRKYNDTGLFRSRRVQYADGQTIKGKIGDIVDAGEEAEDYGYEEDSITVYSEGKAVTIPQSEIKSIETL